MTFAIAVIVDTTLVLAVGLLAAALLRRRSAALRHWVLLAAMCSAALTPVLELTLPPWKLALRAPSMVAISSNPLAVSTGLPITVTPTSAAAAMPSTTLDRNQLLAMAWAAGATAGALVLCVGLLRLSRLARHAAPVDQGPLRRSLDALASTTRHRRVRLLVQQTHPGLVVTWGIRRPTILLPTAAIDWPESRQQAVLLHELAHVMRGDWAIRIFAVIMRCAFWFNPLMWIVDRRVQHESERACDDEVMRAGVRGTDYAGHLLAVAREAIVVRSRWSPATAVAQPSTLEERIQAMLTTGLDRQPLGRKSRAAALIALMGIVVPLAAISPTERTSSAINIDSSGSTPRVGDAVVRPWSEAIGSGQATASIVGVLYDQHSGLLPGVEVTLTQDATGASQTVTSDGSGTFSFRDLPPSDYTLVTNLAGFQRVRNMIRLSAGAQLQRNILLPLGTLTETVTVSNDGVSNSSKPGVRPERELPEPRIASPCVGRVGGCVKPPRKVFHVSPVYPSALAAAGVTGQVVLSGRVGLDGYMNDLQLVDPNAQVHPDLVAAAIEGVRQWEFNPTYLNGAPVEAAIRITVNFVNAR